MTADNLTTTTTNKEHSNMHKSTINTIKPDTLYRLRGGQGVIHTTSTVLVRDGMLAAESYSFVYQPYEQEPTIWWDVKQRTSSSSSSSSGWEPVPTYAVWVSEIWTEIQIVPAAVKETEVS